MQTHVLRHVGQNSLSAMLTLLPGELQLLSWLAVPLHSMCSPMCSECVQ